MGAGLTGVDAVRGGWSAFCEDLRRLGDELLDLRCPADGEEAAEVLLYMTRMLRGGLDFRLEGNDMLRPHLHWYDRVTNGAGGFAPNLDNTYLRARLDGGETYRLVFDAGTYDEVNVAVHAGSPLDGTFSVHGDLTLDHLVVEDGRIEIVLGGAPGPTNWIEMPAHADWLFIRFWYFDWVTGAPPTVTLDRVDPTPNVSHWAPEVVLDGLADSVGWVRRTILGTQGWRDRFLGRGDGPNDLFPPAPEPGGPPQILYGGAHTLLEPDQALVVEFTPPRARTWNVNWHHLPWGDSADVLRQQTSLNHTQSAIDGDGRVRIVVAGRDPGVANWIDTAGRREGILLYRWMWSEDAPVPSGTVVPVDDVLGVLPPDTALVDTDGRAAQLASRRAHLARRY